MKLDKYIVVRGVYRVSPQEALNVFEQNYLAVRSKEGRVYSDELVRQLPAITSSGALHKEWEIRRESAQRLFKYCNKKKIRSVLEVGCGNGWLCNFLSGIKGIEITGIDVNIHELEQATRVFKKDNLCFVYDEFTSSSFSNYQFDVILFAASIQYFPSLTAILELAQQKISEQGEIHIIDTNFYKATQVQSAKKRTSDYYTSLGFPEMANHYFHHTIEELRGFNYKLMFNPHSFINKAFGRGVGFPWFCIKKHS